MIDCHVQFQNAGPLQGLDWRLVIAYLADPVLGVLWAATGLPLCSAVDRFTQLLRAAAAPSALFGLGAALSAVKLSQNLGEPMAVTFNPCR